MSNVQHKAARAQGGGASVSPRAGNAIQGVASDTVQTQHGLFTRAEELSSVDPNTMTGDGSWQRPLAARVNDTRQTFRYVANGGEGQTFVVHLPNARNNANYNPIPSCGTVTNLLEFQTPIAGILATQFTLKSTPAPLPGDVIMISIVDLTS